MNRCTEKASNRKMVEMCISTNTNINKKKERGRIQDRLGTSSLSASMKVSSGRNSRSNGVRV